MELAALLFPPSAPPSANKAPLGKHLTPATAPASSKPTTDYTAESTIDLAELLAPKSLQKPQRLRSRSPIVLVPSRLPRSRPRSPSPLIPTRTRTPIVSGRVIADPESTSDLAALLLPASQRPTPTSSRFTPLPPISAPMSCTQPAGRFAPESTNEFAALLDPPAMRRRTPRANKSAASSSRSRPGNGPEA